jgi:hypothetical protein
MKKQTKIPENDSPFGLEPLLTGGDKVEVKIDLNNGQNYYIPL